MGVGGLGDRMEWCRREREGRGGEVRWGGEWMWMGIVR